MKKWEIALRRSLLAATLLLGTDLLRGEDFEQARLQAGRAAYQQKNYLEAIDQFRMAGFGFLDQPVLLSGTLARLYLAQQAVGKMEEADQTMERFLLIEARFGGFAKADLEPGIRADFRAQLLRRVSEATLLGIPTLAGLVETEQQKIAKLPPDQRRKALEAAAKREPNAASWPIALAAEALERGEDKDASQWAAKALSLDAANPEALSLHAQARLAMGGCADVLKDLAAMPQAELGKKPELYAGKFVCLVETGDFGGAEQVSTLVPASLSGRSDVAKARQKLSVEQQRQRAAQAATAPPKSTAPAPAAAAASTSQTAPRNVPPPGARPASAPAPGPKKSSEPAPVDPTVRSRDALTASRRLVSEGKSADAERILTEALKSDRDNRDLRLELLEAACLARSYPIATAQIALVEPFGEAEAPSMFYAAIALYESGRAKEARGYLEKSASKVSGPLVDEYTKKILARE